MTLGQFDGILDANVYGVQVPGRDGRAGMAAIVARDTLDLPLLHDYLAAQLPEYARPVFLRIRQEIDVTATSSRRRSNWSSKASIPPPSRDPIYFNDPASKAFVRMDAELFGRINAGEVRL